MQDLWHCYCGKTQLGTLFNQKNGLFKHFCKQRDIAVDFSNKIFLSCEPHKWNSIQLRYTEAAAEILFLFAYL